MGNSALMIINELLMKKPLITCIIFRLILKAGLVEGGKETKKNVCGS
jgi:hypothetical protein